MAGHLLSGYLALGLLVAGGLSILAGGTVLAVKYQSIPATLAAGAVSFVGLGLAVAVAMCLRVKVDPPEGVVLEPGCHPDLFRALQEFGDSAGGVRFHEVRLIEGLEISVVHVPRLGALGWHRSYLGIGLPVVELLPPDELRALVAHEIGALSQVNGSLGPMVRKLRGTWSRVAPSLPRTGSCPLSWVLVLGFRQRFEERAALLARREILAGDEFAARMVSSRALATGLCRMAVGAVRMEREVREPAELAAWDGGDIVSDFHDRALTALTQAADERQSARWLREVLAGTTLSRGDATAEGISLAERLAALEQKVEEVLPVLREAAVHGWLDPAARQAALDRFNREWMERMRTERLRQAMRVRVERASESRDAWERVAALARLDGLEKIQPEVISLLDRNPRHSGALLLRGSYLADQNDPLAVDFLEGATADPTLAVRAYEVLERWHTQRNGQETGVVAIRERARLHAEELRAALVERSRLEATDGFFPQDLCEADHEALREVLRGEPAVRRAWLAAKEVKHFPTWPLLVVGLDLSRPLSGGARRGLEARLSQLWGGEAYVQVFTVDDSTADALASIRRKVPQALVFRRK